MKKLFILAFAMVSALPLFSQESTMKSKVIKFTPQHFITNTLTVGLEMFNANFDKSHNVSLGLISSSDESGFEGEYQYRVYVKPFRPVVSLSKQVNFAGVYFSPFLKYTYYNQDETREVFDWQTGLGRIVNTTHNVNALNPGVIFGLQHTLFEVLYMDLFIGGGVRFADVVTKTDDPNFDPVFYNDDIFEHTYKGVLPKIGVSFGIGF